MQKKQKKIVNKYIEGLNELKDKYNDQEYLSFVNDLQTNNCISAFLKTASLATLREVPDDRVLKTKKDIDNYFKKH